MITYLPGYSKKKSQPLKHSATHLFHYSSPCIIFFLYKKNKHFTLAAVSTLFSKGKCPYHSVFIKSPYFFLSGTWIHFSKGVRGSKGPELEKTTPGGPRAAPTPLTLGGLILLYVHELHVFLSLCTTDLACEK